MEVKPGYKQTEVGVIPEDWEITAVGRVAEVKTGPFGSALHEKDYVTDGTPIITVEHLTERGVSHSNLPLVSDADKARLKAYVLRQDDIVFSRVGSVDRNALIKSAEDGWLFSGRLLRVRPTSRTICAPYLSYHFHSDTFKQRVRDVAVGQTMASINTQILKGVSAVLPPTRAEQEAIAEALSDADALIESMEQLLAKKRQIKQGAMQELLTGKKRLPGFSGEWEVKKVCELGNLVTGGTPSTQWSTYWGEEFPWVTPTDISGQKDIHATERQLTSEGLAALRALPANSVLVTCIASIGKNAILRRPGACNQQINAVVPTAANDVDFLYYLFEASKQYLLANAGITATLIISKRAFSELSFCVPSADEQSAIAAILSDMDAEIAALEAKLAKARQIKQGMMQELLTGRIRLV